MILQRLFPNKVTQTCLIHYLSPRTSLAQPCSARGFASTKDGWDQKSMYAWFLPVQTRWKDNDQYLHVNNSVYHAMFDSVINVYLIR